MARDPLGNLRGLLATSGVPYSIERSSSCYKIRVNGRLVQTLPQAPVASSHRTAANALATVRRAIRQYQQDHQETAK